MNEDRFQELSQQCQIYKEEKLKKLINRYMRDFPRLNHLSGLSTSLRNSELEQRLDTRMQSKSAKL